MPDNNGNRKDSILRHLDRDDLDRVLRLSTVKRVPKGVQIVRVLDRDTNFYIIDSGTVRVTLYSFEGKEVTFVDIGPGGHFGEIAAIDGMPRSANVVALEDTVLTFIPSAEFIKLLRTYPEMSLEVLRRLTGVVRRLCDRIFEYSTLGVGNRVCAELLRIANDNVGFDGVARIKNPPTQLELANRISCTREAISREMKKLERSGVLRRQQRQLFVEDMDRLRDLINDA